MGVKDEHRNGDDKSKGKPHGSSLDFFTVCGMVDSKHGLFLFSAYVATVPETATGSVMVKELVRWSSVYEVQNGYRFIQRRGWKVCLWGFLGHPLITPYSGMGGCS